MDKKEPLSMVIADHLGDDVVRVTFSDGSTACMTVAQYDAIVDWGMEGGGSGVYRNVPVDVSAELFQKLEADLGLMCEGAKRCTCQASFIVKIHAVHNCDITPDQIFFLCKTCTDAVAYRIGETVGMMYAQLSDSAETVECVCESCGKTVTDLHDIFTMERLIPK